MNRFARLVPAVLIVLAAAPAPAQLPFNETAVEAKALALVRRAHILTPASPSVAATLEVDSADKIHFAFGSASKTLEVRLMTPVGDVITIGDPDTPTVKTIITPDPIDQPGAAGANYLAEISGPVAGTWSYEITEAATLAGPRAVLLTFVSNSPVRLAVFGGGDSYRIDRPISLAVVVVEGESPATGVTVAASLASLDDPAISPVPVDFVDDGSGADFVAGDGLFTSGFTVPSPGRYKVELTASGISSTAQPFERSGFAEFEVTAVRASLSGLFSDRGIDLDGDSRLDQIGVAAGVEVLVPGRYRTTIQLVGSNGNIILSSVEADLAAGPADPEALFPTADIRDALGVDGPYDVAVVQLEFIDVATDAPADSAFGLGQTVAYQLGDFQREPITLLAGGAAVGTDVDANGKFDFLDVVLPIDVMTSAFYRWSARLVGTDGVEIALAADGRFLLAGESPIELRFDGLAIGDNGLDSPYFVRSLIIFGAGESLIVSRAFTADGFEAAQFETSNVAPLAVCRDVTVAASPDGCVAEASVDGGSSDPDGDPVTLTQDPPGPYGLGQTAVTLTVTDDSGLSDQCTATVTVVDETAPAVLCEFVPQPEEEELFAVVFSATDACTGSPGISGALRCGELSVGVASGQLVEVESDDECETELDDGLLEIEGPLIELVVSATDDAGNSGSCLAQAPGESDDDSDSEEDSDSG